MDADALQSELAALAAEQGVPGAQVGLQRGDERVVVCAGVHGVEDPTPVDPGSLFHAGSITKAVTGLTVLEAARRGLLDLDAPCSAQGPGQWDHSPRSLLAQTTGMQNLLPDGDEPIEAFVARTAALPPVHAPGRFSYCNAGWSALDLLLRQTTGATFEQAAQDLLGELHLGVPDGATPGHGVSLGGPPVPVPLQFSPAASAAGSRWWATADDLLDHATLHLRDGDGLVDAEVVRGVRAPGADLAGATVFDTWGHGWALWERGSHRAFGWAGFTAGHRAYLRCFPDHDRAALVVLANSAGPLFGPPGGSALFDALLPRLLEVLELPPVPEPEHGPASPAAALAGRYGPIDLEAVGEDTVRFDGAVFGSPGPVTCERVGGNTFAPAGRPPGATPIAVDGDLLYLGPFAVPRAG